MGGSRLNEECSVYENRIGKRCTIAAYTVDLAAVLVYVLPCARFQCSGSNELVKYQFGTIFDIPPQNLVAPVVETESSLTS